MNDIQNGPENFNENFDNENSTQNKRPNTLLDLLLGIGISAAAYVLIWLAALWLRPVVISTLIDFIILAACGFLTVRFFRTAHMTAAITMLVLISPGVLALLLVGACSLMFSPY